MYTHDNRLYKRRAEGLSYKANMTPVMRFPLKNRNTEKP